LRNLPRTFPRSFQLTCQSSAGAHRLNVTEWGETNNPNVLICVHGLTRCGRDFDSLARAMSDKYRVLCPDIVGRGESDWLNNKSDYNYPQYVSDMVRLIAKSGVKSVHWVGTSMGGIIGMLLAAQPHSPISRFVINDVGTLIPKASLERIAKFMDAKASPVFATLEQAIATVRAISPFGPLTDQQWRNTTIPLLKPTDDGKWQFRYDPAIALPLKGQPIQDVDLSPFWNEIQCPVLITRGVNSDLLLKSTYDAMCTKQNVRGIEFADTGHAPMFQDDTTIAPVRSFLLEGTVTRPS
jgi:pimeloyl-ACP methyl ester carboxylesterase